MKAFITPIYIFTPGIAGAGTVNLLGIDDFNIKRLVAVINQTSGSIIYSTADPALDFTTVSGTTITLATDTSTMSSNDTLQVIYDNKDAIQTDELIQATEALRMAVQALTRSGIGQSLPDGSGRLRILLDAITTSLTLATITTVGTVSNQTNIGGFSANPQTPSLMNGGADLLRRNISVT
jgi:hypothetical protein